MVKTKDFFIFYNNIFDSSIFYVLFLASSQEKYEKELKDTRARELMYAEEAAILDKVWSNRFGPYDMIWSILGFLDSKV